MSTFLLKLIAIGSMTVDHTGKILFGAAIPMQIIGRIAFPIFAWLIAHGYRQTHSVKKYFWRLVLFGVISQIPYQLAFEKLAASHGWVVGLNIFFTLAAGLLAIASFERFRNPIFKLGSVLLIAFIAELLRFDYGLYGVLLIFIFHISYTWHRAWQALAILSLTVLLYTPIFELIFFGTVPSSSGWQAFFGVQIASIAALPLLWVYDGTRGPKAKWLFYLFYPLHLIVLYGVSQYMPTLDLFS